MTQHTGDATPDRLFKEISSDKGSLPIENGERHYLTADRLLWRESDEYQALFAEGAGGANFKEDAQISLAGASGCIGIAAALFPIAFAIEGSGLWSVIFRVGIAVVQIGLAVLASSLLVYTGGRYGSALRAFYDRLRKEDRERVDRALFELKKSKLNLPDLFILNRSQLDEYLTMTVRQERVTFRNAQIASGAGFAILILGILLSFRAQDVTAQYATAGLSGLGSLLSAFIAAIFFRSWSHTTRELRQYYFEPFRTAQVLSIERLAREGRDGSLDSALAGEIIKSLLAQVPSSWEKIATDSAGEKVANSNS
jgi:hypothetical protein